MTYYFWLGKDAEVEHEWDALVAKAASQGTELKRYMFQYGGDFS